MSLIAHHEFFSNEFKPNLNLLKIYRVLPVKGLIKQQPVFKRCKHTIIRQKIKRRVSMYRVKSFDFFWDLLRLLNRLVQPP